MDNGYGMFRELLEYKLKWEGKKIVRVDRFFPSSKKCCKCGRVKKELKLRTEYTSVRVEIRWTEI